VTTTRNVVDDTSRDAPAVFKSSAMGEVVHSWRFDEVYRRE